MPSLKMLGLVTNRSSPTSCTLLPSAVGQQLPALPVVLGHAVLDGDDRVLRAQAGQKSTTAPSVEALAFAFEVVLALLEELGRGRVERRAACPRRPCSRPCSIASRMTSRASSLDCRGSARSRLRRRPRCASLLPLSTAFSAWKTSAPQRRPRRSVGAPTGITMNSCKSTLLSACAPPLRMFIIGTGSDCARAPPAR